MVYGGINKWDQLLIMDAAAEIGKDPVVRKHQIPPDAECGE